MGIEKLIIDALRSSTCEKRFSREEAPDRESTGTPTASEWKSVRTNFFLVLRAHKRSQRSSRLKLKQFEKKRAEAENIKITLRCEVMSL